jgi:hypothetical protein
MRKAAIFIAVVIVVAMIVKVCAQQTGKKSILPPNSAQGNTYNLTLNYSRAQEMTIDKGILGVNTGFTFKDAVDKSPAFLSLAKMIRPNILRFPGGTVANYYHPNSPGYGYKYSEVLPIKALHPLYMSGQKTNENIIENFIRLCKSTGAKATYCANLLTGTPQEALSVIRRLKAGGVDLAGVELGNEFNLVMYRTQCPTVKVYINRAKLFAMAIRKEFPGLPIGVIMGDEVYFNKLNTQRGKFQHLWSMELAKENFYDAVIVHYYPTCNTCNDDYLENSFQKNWTAIAPYNTHYLDTLAKYVQIFFPGKKIWITEWNNGNWTVFNNTFLQAAFTSQFLLSSIDANARYNNLFDILNFHFLGTDGLIYETTGKLPPIQSAGIYATSSAYYAFSYLSYIISQRSAKLINSELDPEKNVTDLTARTFIANDTVFLYFVNSGNNKYNIHFSKTAVAYSIEYIKGSYLSSVAGKTYFDKNYDAAQLSPIKLAEKTYTGTEFLVDSYSVGYIEFKPSE